MLYWILDLNVSNSRKSEICKLNNFGKQCATNSITMRSDTTKLGRAHRELISALEWSPFRCTVEAKVRDRMKTTNISYNIIDCKRYYLEYNSITCLSFELS